jgi:hypothetical protein
MGGTLPRRPFPGHTVRPVTKLDVPACLVVCQGVHGIRRELGLSRGMDSSVARLVERDGRVVAYTSGLGLPGYATAETNEDLVDGLGNPSKTAEN